MRASRVRVRPDNAREVGVLARAQRRAAYPFLLPTVIVLLLVAGWPLVRTIHLGLTDARLGAGAGASFVGLENYQLLLTDPRWWQAARVTVLFTLVSVALETVLGLVIALALHARLPGRGMLRAAVLVPWAIPTVVSAQIWGWMYHDLYGVVNVALLWIGVITEPWAWTADPTLAFWSMVAVDVWKTTPFMALLILAALQTLPIDIYEAARVDGVNAPRAFFLITLPLIWPALMVAVIFRTLDALRMFDLAYVLTGGNERTATIAVFIRQQLVDFQDVGYGSAAAGALMVLIALAVAMLMTAGRVRLTESVQN